MPTFRPRKTHTRLRLEARVRQLEYDNERLRVNKEFGCLTRQGLDLIIGDIDILGCACVYWDMDDMKGANTRWGKEVVNVRIHDSMKTRPSDCTTGQVFSGDEFGAFPMREDAIEMANRLLMAFRKQELSATFVVVYPQAGETPAAMLKRADALCAARKQSGHRNAVFLVP